LIGWFRVYTFFNSVGHITAVGLKCLDFTQFSTFYMSYHSGWFEMFGFNTIFNILDVISQQLVLMGLLCGIAMLFQAQRKKINELITNREHVKVSQDTF